MKNWKIIAVNIFIVVFVLGGISIYLERQKKTVLETAIQTYENTATNLEKVIESYMLSEQQLVNSWKNTINGKSMPIEDAIKFLNIVIEDERISAHIIWLDDYSDGISTQPRVSDQNNFKINYSDIEQRHLYETTPAKVLNELRNNQNLIKMSPAFTNPVSGNKVITFGQIITLNYKGKPREAFLLYVLPVDFLREKWILATEYHNSGIALIEQNGNYIFKPNSMKNSNFYEFIYSYNKIPQEYIQNKIFTSEKGSISALDSRKHKCIYAYAMIQGTQNHSIVMGMSDDVLNSKTTEWPIIIATMIAMLLALACNTFFFNLSSKKEHQQIEIIKKQGHQLEQALIAAQHANNAKTVFLNNVSHDVRTPMNAIIGFTSLAITHSDQPAVVRDYLKKIMTSSEHLLSLINDVLDMSRIESGKVKIEEREASLPSIMHDIRNILQTDVKSKRLDFYIDTVDVVHENIICDKLRLNQILINLMSNSTKFTNPGGTVGLRVIEKAGAPEGFADFEFHIKDTGIGMSAEFVKHIFEPFTREENEIVSRTQGSGLGMAITKNIIDIMNGRIEVLSKQGEGTEIIVYLRFKTSEKAIQIKVIKRLEGFRALIADDSMDNCIGVSRMLKTIGMRPEWSTSGKEALFRAKNAIEEKDPFKAYIIDWLMPDMNGLEVVREIRKDVGNEIPIIILTAYDWSAIEDEAKKAGVTAFCAKPLFMSELYELLQSAGSVEKDDVTQTIIQQKFINKRILLVDDVELNREIAIAVLEEAGINVEIAENGKAAIDKITGNPEGYYNLVLMDIMMPVLNGYEATKLIRNLENKAYAEIPIVAMTANAFDSDREAALDAGMNDHIAKPFQIDELYKVLTKYLNKEC